MGSTRSNRCLPATTACGPTKTSVERSRSRAMPCSTSTSRLAQLSARVVEQGSAVPIVGANVYVRGSAPETAHVRGDKQTDDFGQVSLTGIEPGEIVLEVYKAGYEMHREKIAYSSPITDKTISLRKSAGVEVRVQPGSRRFPRGFTLTQSFPGNDYGRRHVDATGARGPLPHTGRTGRNHVSDRALQRRAHRVRRLGRSAVRPAVTARAFSPKRRETACVPKCAMSAHARRCIDRTEPGH